MDLKGMALYCQVILVWSLIKYYLDKKGCIFLFIKDEVVNSDIKDDTKLWRYMDFTKLVSLISTKKMYFPRSDQFKDVFEGKIYGYEREDARKTLEGLGTKPGRSYRIRKSERIEDLLKSVYERSERDKKNIFVNCWHLNEFESAAMWDLYLKNEEGVAIQTTFDRVKKSLEACEEEIYVGKVEYIDPIKQKNLNTSFLEPFFTKRMSFSHEKEVRLVYAPMIEPITEPMMGVHEEKHSSENMLGKNIQMNLDELIEKVYVSPDAAPWFVDVVKVVLEKFNINAEVIHSDLYEIK
ncbi:DUF2971 domain-containing protein [Bacillus paramycoides]|uniref:DUF2971 domain-containing protein n=1 Tax=Bacillus paramycoides TaxID=2026194 RepID=UPI003CFD1249